MSDVERLLSEASSLPWRPCFHLMDTNSCDCRFYGEISSESADVLVAQMGPCQFPHRHEEGCGADMIPVADEPHRKANGQLIVYATNHLPAYEAAVEALERAIPLLEDEWSGTGEDSIGNEWLRDARAALVRLRDEVPA